MRKRSIFLLISILLILAGCKTTEPKEATPISWKKKQAYLKRGSDPRIFGLGIYETPAGSQIRGGGRVHSDQAEVLRMLMVEPLRPVVNLHGNFGVRWPVLLDFTASASRLEFDAAQKLGSRPIGEQGKAELIKWAGDEIPSCLSLISSLRLGQLFVENQLVYVRLATGPLGPAARGIDEPVLKGVVGWDVLQKLEQIQFLYSVGRIILKTTEAYEPNPGLLAAQFPLVKHVGACVVRGKVNGQAGLILIDPAGDFEVAADGEVSSVTLGSEFTISSPVVSPSPGGVRIGARLLKNYQVTICPKAGVVYFEVQPVVAN